MSHVTALSINRSGLSLRRSACLVRRDGAVPVAAVTNIPEYRGAAPAAQQRRPLGGSATRLITGVSTAAASAARRRPAPAPVRPVRTTSSSATPRREQRQWGGSPDTRDAQASGHKTPAPLRAFRTDAPGASASGSAFSTALAEAAQRLRSTPQRFVNAGVMATFLGTLAERFVTVDADKWSHWSVGDIFAHMPADNLMAYQDCLSHNPLGTAMLVTGATYYFGDWIAQTCQGCKVMEFDATRLLRATLLGLVIFGPLMETYYQLQADLFHGWFPSDPWYAEGLKVMMDQTAFCFTYNLLYYLGDGTLRGRPLTASLAEFKAVWWKLQTAGWKFWPFVGVFTHTVIPLEHKVLFVDLAEVLWVTYLSLNANSESQAALSDGDAQEDNSADKQAMLSSIEESSARA